MAKIISCLWFDDQAEEAAAFYVSVFPNSGVGDLTRYGPDMPGPEGEVATVSWTLDGHEFLAINGGPLFTFSEAVSFPVVCADQDEVDYYWTTLSAGGEEGPCGWLKDRYGLSWQVVPQRLIDLETGTDRDVAHRAMHAMLGMKRLDIAEIERAAAG